MSDVMVLFYKKFGEILSRAAAAGGQCKEPEALPGHPGFDPRRPQYFRDTWPPRVLSPTTTVFP
jgi:hypothetical protein